MTTCEWVEEFAQFIESSHKRAGAAVDEEIKALRALEKLMRARHDCRVSPTRKEHK